MKNILLLLILTLNLTFLNDVMAGKLQNPYFVSLKSNSINARTGPSTRYPIKYRYNKQGMPLKVVAKFDHWLQVVDVDNTKAWIHKSLLKKIFKTIIIEQGDLYSEDHHDIIIAILKPRMLVNLYKCNNNKCLVSVGDYKGWFEKRKLWGIPRH